MGAEEEAREALAPLCRASGPLQLAALLAAAAWSDDAADARAWLARVRKRPGLDQHLVARHRYLRITATRDPGTLLSVASHAPVIARLLSSPSTGARRRGEEANVRGVLTFVIVLLAIGSFEGAYVDPDTTYQSAWYYSAIEREGGDR